MRIRIQSKRPEDMRYDTVGDWYYERDVLHIDVAERRLGDDRRFSPDEQFLVALHELVESWLCDARCISQETVDQWDMQNSEGPEEPGDNINCPYRREHRFAMLVEHLMAHELGVRNYGEVK